MGFAKGVDVGCGVSGGRVKGRMGVKGVVLIARGGYRQRWRGSCSGGGGGR